MSALALSRSALRVRGYAAACLIGGLAGASIGLSFPLLSLALENRFASGPIVGWNAVMAAVSTVIGAAAAPWLLSRFTPRGAVTLSALAGAATFMGFAVATSLWSWMALRFAFGFGATVVFITAEIWVNQLAPDHQRGRLMGLFGAALATGLGVGAGLFALLNGVGAAGYVAGAGLLAFCGVVIWAPAPRPRPPTTRHLGLRAISVAARGAPLAIAAALAFGAIETVSLNFLPVFASRAGYGENGAAALMIAAAVGNIALTPLIGRAADAVGPARMLIGCGAAACVGPLCLILVPAGTLWAAAPVVFVFAGFAAGLYAVGLAHLGRRTPTGALANANAAFVMCYGLGSLAGPGAAGVMIDIINPNGLLLTLAAFAGAFLLVGAGILRRKH